MPACQHKFQHRLTVSIAGVSLYKIIKLNNCTPTYRPNPVEVDSLLDKQVRWVACGAEHMGCTVVHGWVPDEEAKSCMACKKSFTTIRRRVSLIKIFPQKRFSIEHHISEFRTSPTENYLRCTVRVYQIILARLIFWRMN